MHFSVSRPCPTVISKSGMRRVRNRAEGADLGDDAGHLADAQLADAAWVQTVFVAEGQVVEQVLDRADALLQQNFGEPGADAFDVLDVGSEIEHRTNGK